MSDLRETVAQAIGLRYTDPKHRTPELIDTWWDALNAERPERVDDFLAMADAAITAARPIIRAELFDEFLNRLNHNQELSNEAWDEIVSLIHAQREADRA